MPSPFQTLAVRRRGIDSHKDLLGLLSLFFEEKVCRMWWNMEHRDKPSGKQPIIIQTCCIHLVYSSECPDINIQLEKNMSPAVEHMAFKPAAEHPILNQWDVLHGTSQPPSPSPVGILLVASVSGKKRINVQRSRRHVLDSA